MMKLDEKEADLQTVHLNLRREEIACIAGVSSYRNRSCVPNEVDL